MMFKKKNVLCRTLLGTNNLDFSLECLKSFIQNSYDLIRLEIFEDGTMKEPDIKRIESFLENTVVITKASRETDLLDKLSNYPQCLNFRKKLVLSYKVLDIMLYDNKDFFFLDTDVFFVRKFVLPDFDNSPIFMKDNLNGYFFKPNEFLKIETSILPFVNSGFFYFPNSLYDLSSIELLLNKHFGLKHMGHTWAEQTLFSFLAAKSQKAYYFKPEQVVLGAHKMKLNNEVIAIHLVRGTRFHFDSLKTFSKTINRTDYKKIETQPITSILTNLTFAFSWLKSKFDAIDRRVTKANIKVKI